MRFIPVGLLLHRLVWLIFFSPMFAEGPDHASRFTSQAIGRMSNG